MRSKLLITLFLLSLLLAQQAIAQIPSNVDPGAIQRSTERVTPLTPDQETVQPSLPEEKIDTSEIKAPEAEAKPAEAQSTVLVKTVIVNRSEILSEEEIRRITSGLVDKEVSIDELNKVVNEINALYAKKGYITARAFLPPQTVKDGTIEIKLVEGHIGAINVEGNRFTKTDYITDKIHQEPGDLLQMTVLERDILKFNRTNDIKVRANLKPGTEFGTTDVNLVVDDPNPYHITAVFDNTGRETVGVLRGGLSFNTASLLGYRDQFSMGYSRAKSTDVAYSSYTFPIGNRGTRIGGSFAFSNIRISSGPFEPLNIEGNSFNYSGFINQQFISTRRFDLFADMSVNFRQVTTFLDEIPLFTTQIRSLTQGLTFVARDNSGRWVVRNEITNGLDLLGGNARFFKYNGNLTRLQSFGHGIIGIFRAATQLTPDHLPPVEQFQIGGSGTVRGYSEGLLIGDDGYFLSGELRFPIPILPKKIGKYNFRDKFNGVVFVDHGGTFRNRTHIVNDDFLTSVGLGLRASLTKYIDGRVDWGFGLVNREHPQPTARLHFGLEAKPF